MTSEAIDRSKASALKVVLGLRTQVLAGVTDEAAQALLSEDFVTEIFDVAWENQFEEDRRAVRRQVRQIVADAIEERRLEGDEGQS